MICGTGIFPRIALLNFVVLMTWDGVLGKYLELPKGSQATFPVGCGLRDGSGANAG